MKMLSRLTPTNTTMKHQASAPSSEVSPEPVPPETTMFDLLPPALVMVAGAALLGLVRGHWRALLVLGTPLVDDRIELSLEYSPQAHFYIRESAALYLREHGAAAIFGPGTRITAAATSG